MRFVARDAGGQELLSEDYYSLGGGFIARGDEPEVASQTGEPPYPYDSADSLLRVAAENDLSIAELIYANELTWRKAGEIRERMNTLWAAMESCIERGLRTEGVLPGKLSVLRRAARLHKRLTDRVVPSALDAMEWVNVFAIAVNEENAAGGRVVTSPTNGAAGIIPAVMMYYARFVPDASAKGRRIFMLTAGAIGVLYKTNASISGGPRWAVRVRSVSRVPWPQAGLQRRLEATMIISRKPRKSAWNTTSG